MASLQRQHPSNPSPRRVPRDRDHSRTRTHPRARHVLPCVAPPTTPFEDQMFIAQSLQVLSLIKHKTRNALGQRCTTQNVPKLTQETVEILDTIALLVTLSPGDVVVAAFDKRARLSVLLTIARRGEGYKNTGSHHGAETRNYGPRDGSDTSNLIDHPTLAHQTALHDFISLLTNPDIVSVSDMFPYVVKHCGSNMERCIRKLHDSASTFAALLDFDSVGDDGGDGAGILASYVPARSFDLEFPESKEWVAEHYPSAKANEKSTILTILSELLSDISELSSLLPLLFTHHISDRPSNITHSHYHALTTSAHVLMHSRFLDTLIEAHTFSSSTRPRSRPLRPAYASNPIPRSIFNATSLPNPKSDANANSQSRRAEALAQAVKLKNRLQTICRYDQGVNVLLWQAKRVFEPSSVIPVRWIVPGRRRNGGSGSGSCGAEDYEEHIDVCATPAEAIRLCLDGEEYPSAEAHANTDTTSPSTSALDATLAHLHTTHPTLFSNWESHIQIHVHPSIRLALYLTENPPPPPPPPPSSSSPPSSFAARTPFALAPSRRPRASKATMPPFLPLGSTKPPCLACAIWFSAFMDARCVFGRHRSGRALPGWGVPPEECGGSAVGAGKGVSRDCETGGGTNVGEPSGSVGGIAVKMRVLRGLVVEGVKREVEGEMKGVLEGLGKEGGVVPDGSDVDVEMTDRDTETDVSMGSEESE